MTTGGRAIAEVFSGARLVVCVGTGGVGKTTTSAALALRAAFEGRHVLVLTIDPARRLAQAMGLESLDNEPRAVDVAALGGTGSLHAMMLDATTTFDDLIRRTAGPQAKSILENRVYRVMADHLAGVQEYMALERLYELHSSKKWDLIVLDTPPSKNALDFFNAPRRVSAMFDERVMRWFLPDNGEGGMLGKLFNPGAVTLKLLAVMGGKEFVAELAGFFDAIRAVRSSFKERGDAVERILREAATRYAAIASPDPRRVDEALDLRRRMAVLRLTIDLVVLNRSHHRFKKSDMTSLRAAFAASEATEGDAELLTRVDNFYADLIGLSERDRVGVLRLVDRIDKTRIRLVPVLGLDIHTPPELLKLSSYLETV
jgi:anion-transporting  ArsA/GET3 family ATPase